MERSTHNANTTTVRKGGNEKGFTVRRSLPAYIPVHPSKPEEKSWDKFLGATRTFCKKEKEKTFSEKKILEITTRTTEREKEKWPAFH